MPVVPETWAHDSMIDNEQHMQTWLVLQWQQAWFTVAGFADLRQQSRRSGAANITVRNAFIIDSQGELHDRQSRLFH